MRHARGQQVSNPWLKYFILDHGKGLENVTDASEGDKKVDFSKKNLVCPKQQ